MTIALKSQQILGKFTFFIQYFFRPLLSKIGGRADAKFTRPINFYSAVFMLFFRIFGQLATVHGDQLIGKEVHSAPMYLVWDIVVMDTVLN
jgi:hypothetical protein